jgi:hypothetical protein
MEFYRETLDAFIAHEVRVIRPARREQCMVGSDLERLAGLLENLAARMVQSPRYYSVSRILFSGVYSSRFEPFILTGVATFQASALTMSPARRQSM